MTSTISNPPLGGNRILVTGLLSGPVVWIAYFLIIYGLMEAACRAGFFGTEIFGISLAAFIVGVLTVATLAGLGYSGFLAYRNWRAYKAIAGERPNPGRGHFSEDRREFMAAAGTLLNFYFLLVTIFTCIPAFVLLPCD